MAQVIDICSTLEALSTMPKWCRDIYRKPVVYHKDCLIDFKLVRDDTRFAGGITWFCKKCNIEVFSYEEFIPKFDYFAIYTLFCHTGCNAVWRMEEIEAEMACIYEFPLSIKTGKVEWDILYWINRYLRSVSTEECF